ncbi:ankyrin repeat and SOCS box protein 8 [Trichuris trichiura]|uniref:Ankyrin repeat and SOCS box protein 8 n=1 Tax=Trichuris trichiura TaxID=36087 RepID=A0A077YYA1_TRITR|nr:ankyrin repeat and SOCS box protein 8 [Trichuris trichiura]
MWFKLEKMQMRFSRMERLFFIISSRESLERKIEGVKLLVCDDVKLNEMHGGLILLHYACALNELDICELLLQHGADPNVRDTWNRTALHYAAETSADCVELFLKYGALVHVRDNNHCTPLHWAAYKNNFYSVRKLLEFGADPDALDANHDTPLSWAALKGNLESVTMLLEYNCRPDTINLNGNTPLSRLVQIMLMGLGSVPEERCLVLLVKALGNSTKLNVATFSGHGSVELNDFLRTCTGRVPRLMELCRCRIRRSMGPGRLINRLSTLSIPPLLRQYIMLKY